MAYRCMCFLVPLALWIIPGAAEAALGPGEAAARQISRLPGTECRFQSRGLVPKVRSHRDLQVRESTTCERGSTRRRSMSGSMRCERSTLGTL